MKANVVTEPCGIADCLYVVLYSVADCWYVVLFSLADCLYGVLCWRWIAGML